MKRTVILSLALSLTMGAAATTPTTADTVSVTPTSPTSPYTPLRPTYLKGVLVSSPWTSNWFLQASVGTTVFLGFIDDATTFAESHGGGGTTSNLPWGRDDDDDDRAWARRCLSRAARLLRPSAAKKNKR